jgi:hypothetical protein
MSLLAACTNSDVISRQYASLDDAKQDIEKGWIPSILPPSTTAIRDTHDLDLNIGSGTFLYNPQEFDTLMNGASRKLPSNPRGVPNEQELQKWRDKGYFIRTYMTEDTFFIVAANLQGDGHYWMALQRPNKALQLTPSREALLSFDRPSFPFTRHLSCASVRGS